MKARTIDAAVRQSRRNDFAFTMIVGFFLIAFAFLCVYPFWYVLMYSVSDASQLYKGVMFYPRGFTLQYYTMILQMSKIYKAIFISGARTVIGTILMLCGSLVFAYVLTKREFKGRKFMYRLMTTTMYVSGGLIPGILVLTAYGLANTFWLYVIPGIIAPFNVILIKTYIEQLPLPLEESALIDGANYLVICVRIVAPLCVPVLAAVSVFTAVGQWNSWTDNFYLVRDTNLQTLQYILLRMLKESESILRSFQQDQNYELLKNYKPSPMSMRMAITIVSVIPIFIVYPIVQRFFIKGIMLGAIKG
jgi:putative aldouronate transport system permease protein